ICLLSSSGSAASEPGPGWTVNLDAAAAWQRATPAGVLLVGTGAGLVGLDGKTGKTLWRNADLNDDVTLGVLLPSPHALLRLEKSDHANVVRMLIDVTTGQSLWYSSTIGLTDVYHETYVPSLDALLIAGEAAEGNVVLAVDLASGHRLREIAVPEAEARSIFGDPVLFDSE